MENSMWTIKKMKIKKKNIVNNFHLLTESQRLPNMLGQRLYNMLGQRLLNMLGQRLYNMLGQRLYNMLGQRLYKHVGPTFVQHVWPTFFGWAKWGWFCIAQPTLAQQKLQLKTQCWPNCHLLSGMLSLVLLWEVHSSLAIARELCFPKQHYESIVPSKPGINR